MRSKRAEAEVAKIKKNQKVLRDSIEQTKRLAEETDRLLEQNRQVLSIGGTDRA